MAEVPSRPVPLLVGPRGRCVSARRRDGVGHCPGEVVDRRLEAHQEATGEHDRQAERDVLDRGLSALHRSTVGAAAQRMVGGPSRNNGNPACTQRVRGLRSVLPTPGGMTVRRIQIASTLCIATMLAICAACGSSSSNSSSAATEASSATSTPATTTATSTSGGGGGVSDAAFCADAKATAKSLRQVDSQIAAAGTAQGFQTLLTNDQSAYNKLVAEAPSDIHADAQTLQVAFNKIIAFFSKYHYSIQAAAPHIQTLDGTLNAPKLKAAEAHIKAWGDSNCS
jgi:hypothetical protein